MKEVYPVFISKSEDDFLVYIPDMKLYTEGKSFIEAIEMARDAIGLEGLAIEDDANRKFPKSSTYDEALNKAKADKEIFDYSKGVLTYVDVDFTIYRRMHDNKMTRKNVTIPNWLNEMAAKENINVSKVLQEALAEKLGVSL